MKKWLKAALCVLLAILLIVGGYVAYVFIDYHRIGDMALTPSDGGAASVRTVTASRFPPQESLPDYNRETTFCVCAAEQESENPASMPAVFLCGIE